MSEIITLARPYAKAAFEVADDAGALGDWSKALGIAAAVASDPRVDRLIDNPAIDTQQLQQMFSQADAPAGFDNFVALLIQNNRLPLLSRVGQLFEQLKAEAEQALQVTVRSASALDDSYKARMSDALSRRFGKKIELNCEVDEALLGGAVIHAGDQVIDGSLRGKLQRMSDSLQS